MTAGAARAAATAGAARHARTQFACLWAAAALFHSAAGREWIALWPVNLAAAWVLLQPGRIAPLAALALLQPITTVAQAPFISNHQLLTALVAASLLAAIAVHRDRRDARAEGDIFVTAWAPAVRTAVLVFYAYVVFHKLNADFFDPDVSCAGEFYRAQLERLPFLPASSAAEAFAIYLTIGAEAAIPLLLAFARTRHAGTIVGMAFHGTLAFNPKDGFYNFSSMLMPLFYLFAIGALAGRTTARVDRVIRFAARVLLLLFGVIAAAQLSGAHGRLGASDPALWLWTTYSAMLIGGAFLAFRGTWADRTGFQTTFAMPARMFALLPIVVLVNGASPYLGLKTETSWAMFSNLRTEGGRSNHWIVPAGSQIFGYQHDLVRLVSASDRGLQAVADRGYAIPYFELRRKPDMAVVYISDSGERRQFERVADDPAYPGAIPWVLRKALSFRPVAPGNRQPCLH